MPLSFCFIIFHLFRYFHDGQSCCLVVLDDDENELPLTLTLSVRRGEGILAKDAEGERRGCKILTPSLIKGEGQDEGESLE